MYVCRLRKYIHTDLWLVNNSLALTPVGEILRVGYNILEYRRLAQGMLVNFIASRTNMAEDMPFFRQIILTVEKKGHTMARDWIEDVYAMVVENRYEDEVRKADWKQINKEQTDALGKADVVIVEATARSFSSGYQACLAIQSQKPTLLLTRGSSLGGTFRSSLSSDFVRNVEYKTVDELQAAVSKFLEDNDFSGKDLRFNFFIDRKIHTYLRWASYKTGKPQSEIIRELLNREIDDSNSNING